MTPFGPFPPALSALPGPACAPEACAALAPALAAAAAREALTVSGPVRPRLDAWRAATYRAPGPAPSPPASRALPGPVGTRDLAVSAAPGAPVRLARLAGSEPWDAARAVADHRGHAVFPGLDAAATWLVTDGAREVVVPRSAADATVSLAEGSPAGEHFCEESEVMEAVDGGPCVPIGGPAPTRGCRHVREGRVLWEGPCDVFGAVRPSPADGPWWTEGVDGWRVITALHEAPAPDLPWPRTWLPLPGAEPVTARLDETPPGRWRVRGPLPADVPLLSPGVPRLCAMVPLGRPEAPPAVAAPCPLPEVAVTLVDLAGEPVRAPIAYEEPHADRHPAGVFPYGLRPTPGGGCAGTVSGGGGPRALATSGFDGALALPDGARLARCERLSACVPALAVEPGPTGPRIVLDLAPAPPAPTATPDGAWEGPAGAGPLPRGALLLTDDVAVVGAEAWRRVFAAPPPVRADADREACADGDRAACDRLIPLLARALAGARLTGLAPELARAEAELTAAASPRAPAPAAPRRIRVTDGAGQPALGRVSVDGAPRLTDLAGRLDVPPDAVVVALDDGARAFGDRIVVPRLPVAAPADGPPGGVGWAPDGRVVRADADRVTVEGPDGTATHAVTGAWPGALRTDAGWLLTVGAALTLGPDLVLHRGEPPADLACVR